MDGMQIMFKSMGIDIEGIQKVINPETFKQLMEGLQTAIRKQDEIQNSLLRIELKLETLPGEDAQKLLIENSHLDPNPIPVGESDGNNS